MSCGFLGLLKSPNQIFQMAKENVPCCIFMDEIDAIGGKRQGEGSSADREIQRTLMELLNQSKNMVHL